MHQGCYSFKVMGKKKNYTLDSLLQKIKTQAKMAFQQIFQFSKSMDLPKHNHATLPDLGLEYNESTLTMDLVRQSYRSL